MKNAILKASKADAIPAGESGLWKVTKLNASHPVVATEVSTMRKAVVPPGHYTQLFRLTEATMVNGGECVMHDFPQELATHLQFMLKAHGRVLITGLGLGCVIRGCLANPAVTNITVIEKSRDVIKLVWPYMPEKERIALIHADAVEWCKKTRRQFDCAWHDLWTDEGAGEDHLQVVHWHLLGAMMHKTTFQGAWQFPRYFRKTWREFNVI